MLDIRYETGYNTVKKYDYYQNREANTMIYPYMTLADGTEIVHTDIIVKEDGTQTVEINFERPTDTGFNTARCVLPTYQWVIKTGYTQDEIAKFEDFVKRNAHLIYRFAQNGGITVA